MGWIKYGRWRYSCRRNGQTSDQSEVLENACLESYGYHSQEHGAGLNMVAGATPISETAKALTLLQHMQSSDLQYRLTVVIMCA